MSKKRKNFTEEERTFVFENFSKLGPAKCAAELNRNVGSVAKLAKLLGVKYYVPLTDEQVSFIRANYPIKGVAFCASSLGITKNRVFSCVKKLDLKLSKEGKIFSYKKRDKSDDELKIGVQQFLDLDSKEICYMLGLLWADGNVRKYQFGIEAAKTDLLEVLNIFNLFGEWDISTRKKRKGVTKEILSIRTNNKQLSSALIENYDFHRKSVISPSKLLGKIPNNLRFYFWRGFFDGDGHVRVCPKGRYGFSLAGAFTQSWEDMEFLLNELNVKYALERKTKINRKSGKRNSWSVIKVQNFNGFKNFLEYIYQDCLIDKTKFFGLSRKYIKLEEGLNQKEKHHRNLLNRSIRIRVLSTDQELIGEFNSIESVTKNFGIKRNTIKNCLAKKKPYKNKFIFEIIK